MAADKTNRTRRAIWGLLALAVTTGMALVAHAQVMTAPPVKAPVQAPVTRPTAAVTVPYVVAISYPAPGQNPPTAAASFAASALSFYQGTANPLAGLATGAAATQSFVDVTVDSGAISQASAIPAQTTLTAMTITAYKAGAVTMTMNFAQPVLTSRALSPATAGAPRETLRFYYAQMNHTP